MTTVTHLPASVDEATPTALAARAVARYSHLARPVAAALELVEAGHVSGNDIHTQVVSSDGNTIYHQDYHERTGTWTCNCPSFRFRPYTIRAGDYTIALCKHVLARAIADRAGLLEATPEALS